jgi:hypothetical protein
MKLITLLIIVIIIIIIIHSKKYDLLHGGVFDVSKNLIKCASLLKIEFYSTCCIRQSVHSNANLVVLSATIR